MKEIDFDPTTMTRATQEDIERIYFELWGKTLTTKEDEMSQYPTTGYTERVSQAELDRNYQETIKKMVEAYPGNEYWANLLEAFETQLHPVEQAQAIEQATDPRTPADIDIELWQEETQATRNSDYPR